MNAIARCQYHEPTGEQCIHSGRRLRLLDPLGSIVIRFLCRRHSDWQEYREGAGQ